MMWHFKQLMRLMAVGAATLAVVAGRAQTAADTVAMLPAFNIPVVTVTTTDGSLPTCDFVTAPEGCTGMGITNRTTVTGRMVMTLADSVLYDSGPYRVDASGITLRMRGNTSAYYENPPYKVKLQAKSDLLQRGSSVFNNKHWALLNQLTTRDFKSIIGPEVSRLCGLGWKPASRYVNLVLNGRYRGLYLLSETVKESPSRCNVSASGYIMECDPYWWNTTDSTLHTAHLPYTMAYTFKYPDGAEVDADSYAYIKNTLNNFEDALYGGQPVDDLFDTRSLMAWFLAHDILGTWDGCGSNIFVIKNDRYTAPLRMGPLWDFDTDYRKPGQWASVHEIRQFYGPACFARPELVKLYADVWQEVRPKLLARVTEMADSLARNYGRAIDASRLLADPEGGFPTVAANVREVKEWFETRIPWLDAQIDALVMSGIDGETVSPVVQHVMVYAVDGRLCFAGSLDGYAQWQRSASTLRGAYVVRYMGEGGALLRTERMMVR